MKKGRILLSLNGMTLLDVDAYHLIALMQYQGARVHGHGAVDLSNPDVKIEIDGDEVEKPDWMEAEEDFCDGGDMPVMLKKQAD